MAPDAVFSTAALVIVGNEVLSAKVQDVNTPFLLERLRALGVPVRSVAVVPDEQDLMVDAYRVASARATWVFSTGGIGPTHDDITMGAVAAAFDRPLVRNAEVEAILREALGERLNDGHLGMADLPEGAELLYGEDLRFPVVLVENIYVFPGAPGLMRKEFLAIQERFRQTPLALVRLFLRGDEAALADVFEAAERDHAGVQVGSYPIWGHRDHDIVITLEGRDQPLVDAAAASLVAGLPLGCLVRRDG